MVGVRNCGVCAGYFHTLRSPSLRTSFSDVFVGKAVRSPRACIWHTLFKGRQVSPTHVVPFNFGGGVAGESQKVPMLCNPRALVNNIRWPERLGPENIHVLLGLLFTLGLIVSMWALLGN